jgi:hypothetical protein
LTKSQQLRRELALRDLVEKAGRPLVGMSRARYLHVSTSQPDPETGEVRTQTAIKDKRYEKPRGGVAATARRLRQGKPVR